MTDVRAARSPLGERSGRLRALNVLVGLAHGAQALAMLALSNDLALPVTAAFLTDDPVAVRGPAGAEVLFEVPVGPAIAAFLLLAAADHLLVAAPGLWAVHERRLARGVGDARWIEYAVSASLMLVLIAMFAGIRDVAALLGLFAANAAMILFGLLMERHQQPGGADWSAFWFGALVGLVPWVAVAVYVVGAATVPGFVYAIVGLEFGLFAVFAVNMALQYGRLGPWRDYLFGEQVYIWLSLAAKSLLAWLVFANVLRS